jgi:hypothetical protein
MNHNSHVYAFHVPEVMGERVRHYFMSKKTDKLEIKKNNEY